MNLVGMFLFAHGGAHGHSHGGKYCFIFISLYHYKCYRISDDSDRS